MPMHCFIQCLLLYDTIPIVIGTYFHILFRNNVKPKLSLQTKVESKHYEECNECYLCCIYKGLSANQWKVSTLNPYAYDPYQSLKWVC